MHTPREPQQGRDPERGLRWWQAAGAAALGGFLLDVASPGIAWWPAGLLGATLILCALWKQLPWGGLAIGAIAGAAFWFPQISWLTLYLGPIPWLALGTLMTLWFAAMGAVIGPVTRGLARLPLPIGVILSAQVLAAAGIWTARELAQSSWPYGGFAWGRLAHTQSQGPLAELVSWVGFAGLSGLIAAACAVPAAVWFARLPRSGRRTARAAGFSIVGLILLSLVPVAPTQQTGTVRIAAVQGNSDAGIFDDRESGDVLRDHVQTTAEYLDAVEAGTAGDPPELIVWPENSAEFNLPGSAYARGLVDGLARRANAPIVLGSILPADEPDTYTNSSLVWQPEAGVAARYDKRYPVPFAEYMPHREFYRALAPDLVDLVQLDYLPGTLPAAMPISVPGVGRDPLLAGIAICFDIIFDEQAVAMIDDGAEVILAQTNNADFGRTDENAQQLEIARLRAMETGRVVVNISTVGISEMIGPDGRAIDAIEPYTAGVMVADIPTFSGETPAILWGASAAALWLSLGAAGVLLSLASWTFRSRDERASA
ncbi:MULTISPECIES: apolipoprotein N-acyltransferase [unclassified Leucobacter]|uniref:apolipoprotein N-acyltransferase n=1 Tax=unclassified Leucobacter TaxID=2621730 RepID=UPI00165E7B66|nr:MULTISPECIES: apolipoprotein N-acyltransferase [unclassified Leucobacter]MBC9935427.1 apolipoprotein N-acyltransferase [Leucobacter sp. cx-87]